MADDPGPPGLERLCGWVGHRLEDVGGAPVGRVEAVYVGEPGEQPGWVLARMGRFGHHTLIPPRDAVEGVGRVWVPYDRDRIRRAPRLEPGVALTASRERDLIAHYGIVDPERSARLAKLDDGAITARSVDDS